MFARSLARRARVCIAGEGFARIEPTFPACFVDELEHAESVRSAAERMIVAAALVDELFIEGGPFVWWNVMGSR